MTKEEIEQRAANILFRYAQGVTVFDEAERRRQLDLVKSVKESLTSLAVQIYEEAAQIAEKEIGSSRREIAAAIRALKDNL
jgi:hypothetical protein